MTDLYRLVGPLRPAASASESAIRATPDAATLRAALDRLDQFLKSGTPPRPDAPKGFYLNIVV